MAYYEIFSSNLKAIAPPEKYVIPSEGNQDFAYMPLSPSSI